MPPNKEAPFFDHPELYYKGWGNYYLKNFDKAKQDQKIGKITPRYMRDPETANRIYSCMPDIKIFAILRNPVQRTYSHYRMLRRDGKIKQGFNDSVMKEVQNTEHAPQSFIAQSEYYRILKPFYELFPSESIFVLISEELEENPLQTLNSLYGFLDITSDFIPSNLNQKFNKGIDGISYTKLIKRISHLRPLKYLWHLIPAQKRKTLVLKLETNFIPINRAENENLEETFLLLREYYKNDLKKLQSLIGRELPWT